MLADEVAARLERLASLRGRRINPYPASAKRSHTIARAREAFDALARERAPITIVGRVRSKRFHGGVAFAHVEDGTGRMQIALKKDVITPSRFAALKETLDVGDFVQVSGALFATKVGERSLEANEVALLAKGLLPLPEKWHGLSDVEVRFRKRHLDLLANPDVRRVFEIRSKLVRALRVFFDSRGYLEVETPILQPIPGGANARPFATRHNALNCDLYLRIAPELYLKRLIVGGFERVYEISRCFRNEGIDHAHNPEFTQIEWYEAYTDYRGLMAQVEELLPTLFEAAELDLAKIQFDRHGIDFTPPYPRLTFRDAVKKYTALDIEQHPDRDSLAKEAARIGAVVTAADSRGKILDEIYKTFVRPKIINPTFVIDHPIETSPLAKKKTDDPRYVERFQLLVGGMFELINGFSELNDPLDQEERFREQERARAGGEEEAQRFDEDFVEALKVGMPPTGGVGMGVDRLTMLLTNRHNIKEVILFPTLKPLT